MDMPTFKDLPGAWYQILDAMLESLPVHLVPKGSLEEFNMVYDRYKTFFAKILTKSKLDKTSVQEPFLINMQAHVDWSGRFKILTDEELKFWFAVAAEIADFSMLGKNVRDYVINLYDVASAECQSRMVHAPFLCEYLDLSNSFF